MLGFSLGLGWGGGSFSFLFQVFLHLFSLFESVGGEGGSVSRVAY